VANFPPLLTTPAANVATITAVVVVGTGINDTGGKYWEQYQTADTSSKLEGKNFSIC
jgi:hypothetical protein